MGQEVRECLEAQGCQEVPECQEVDTEQAPPEEATLVPRATLKPGSEVLATMLPMRTRVSSLPMLLVLSPLARPRMRTTMVRSWSPGWTLRATRFGARLSGLS